MIQDIIKDDFKVSIINSALERFKLEETDVTLSVIIDSERTSIGITFDLVNQKIVCFYPIEGFTKKFSFTSLQFLDFLTKSSKNTEATKDITSKIGVSKEFIEEFEKRVKEGPKDVEPKKSEIKATTRSRKSPAKKRRKKTTKPTPVKSRKRKPKK